MSGWDQIHAEFPEFLGQFWVFGLCGGFGYVNGQKNIGRSPPSPVDAMPHSMWLQLPVKHHKRNQKLKFLQWRFEIFFSFPPNTAKIWELGK